MQILLQAVENRNKKSNSTNNSTETAVRSNMLFDNSIHENAEKVNIKNKKTAAPSQKNYLRR